MTTTQASPATVENGKLPVADGATVRQYAKQLVMRHKKSLVVIIAVHGAAAIAGLAGPALLGRLVDEVQRGTTLTFVNTIIAIGVVAVTLQAFIIRFGRRYAMIFGE